jgi:hypothetical protein
LPRAPTPDTNRERRPGQGLGKPGHVNTAHESFREFVTGSEQGAGDERRPTGRPPQLLNGGVLDTHGDREEQTWLLLALEDQGEAHRRREQDGFRGHHHWKTPAPLEALL